MSRRCQVVLAIISLFISSLAAASPCLDVPNRIYHDINKYPNTIQQQRLPWKNLSWLEKMLGRPQVMKLANQQIQYSWPCDSVSTALSVITDQNGRFMSISGEYNLNSGSGMFNKTLIEHTANNLANGSTLATEPVSTVTTTETTPPTSSSSTNHVKAFKQNTATTQAHDPIMQAAEAPIANNNQMIPDVVKAYNQHFNINLTTQSEMVEAMISRTKHYYASVRQCLPGTYEIATPMAAKLIFIKSLIRGKQNERCIIENSYDLEGHNTLSRCAYTTQSIALFTPEEAESAAKGTITFDIAHLTPLQQALIKECKVYRDGKLVE